MSGILNWTGHPLVDVGLAGLCALTGRNDPRALTIEDLDDAAGEMKRYYFSGAMGSYLSCVFMNAEYVQPGDGAKKQEARERYSNRVLFAHRYGGDEGAGNLRCVFSGRPATHIVHRVQMPMLTGESVLNFFPAGNGGLPIAGPYLVALQALPLAGRRCAGRLLIAHADDGELTLELARRYLADNRRLLQLALSGGLPDGDGTNAQLPREQASWDAVKKKSKFPDAKYPNTLITSDLVEIFGEKQELSGANPSSVTVYWFSSSGQGPSLEILEVPSQLVRFLVRAGSAEYRGLWKRVEARGWFSPDGGTGKKKSGPELTGPGRSRNRALEDLFSIYEDGEANIRAAQSFLRRHVLGELRGKLGETSECEWALADLVLKEVLGMAPERIVAIREFSDRLAKYVESRNDRQLFRSIVYADKLWELRNELTKAQRNEARQHNALLFGLDEYLAVFEAEDSVGVTDWRLIRDLISIRVVEQLQKSGHLASVSTDGEDNAQKTGEEK